MKRWLWLILLIALGLRLVYGFGQDPLEPYVRAGGDSWWYLVNGNALVTGREPADGSVDVSQITTPPGYLIMVGIAQAIFPPAEAVIAVRIVQALMGVVIVWCGYRLALRLTNRESAGLLAAAVMAVSPIFVIEPSQLYSETLFMFFVSLGLVAYLESFSPSPHLPVQSLSLRLPVFASLRYVFSLRLAACGLLFGLAALTRAPILLFPVGLAIHLLIVYGLRAGWRKVVLLLVVYAAVVSTWTIYNQVRWGRFVIAGDGFAAFVYFGATGWDGPEAADAQLGSTEGGASDEVFMAEAGATISADPLGYIRYRLTDWSGAVLQPHGTPYFPGESLRDLAVEWLTTERSLDGLIAITRGDAFVPKALLYLFHYAALIGGVVGIWRTRRNWRVSLVLIGFIVYLLLIHLVLLALPRYIFPTFIAWIVFASAAIFPPLPDRT